MGRVLPTIVVAVVCAVVALARDVRADDAGGMRVYRDPATGEFTAPPPDVAAALADVLTKGDKDASQPWTNPETGARGSVTPLAEAYTEEGRTCRDFLASYVNGKSESWLQGAACRSKHGRWEVRSWKSWQRS